MKTAAQNRQTALEVLAQRPPEPGELDSLFESIEREAEAGGLKLTTQLKNAASRASVKNTLTENGYAVTDVTGVLDSGGVEIEGIVTISWE